MNTDVRVAVVGGGIVGASVLYWLAKMGWGDAILLERRELTSGSTWLFVVKIFGTISYLNAESI